MSLGTLPGVIGLGELYTLFNKKDRDRHFKSHCSCGKAAAECEFWSDFLTKVDVSLNSHEQYQSTLDLLSEKYGTDSVLVDSSKNSYSYLKFLATDHDLKVIYLTRDYRSWAFSRHQNTRKSYLYFLLRWRLENLKLLGRLRAMNIDHMKVGYEELSLFPELIFQAICDYVGLNYSKGMLTPEKTQSHIISGNIARVDKQKRKQWIYDARWFLSRRVGFWGLLSLLNHSLNRRLVYSNIGQGKMRDFHLFGSSNRKQMSHKYN